MTTELRKNQIRMHSGSFYHFLDPEPSMIKLDDIAHHLSNTCRFAGACSPFYSVAEHSVVVARLLMATGYEKHTKAGILHDAAEAYLWDVPRPAKHLFDPVYAQLTVLCDLAIGERFGIDHAEFHSPVVNEADTLALNYEGNTVMPDWEAEKPDFREGIIDWQIGLSPVNAKRLFLMECNRYGVSAKIDYASHIPEGPYVHRSYGG